MVVSADFAMVVSENPIIISGPASYLLLSLNAILQTPLPSLPQFTPQVFR